ncbi:MAG: 5'/3'-nucleotidase SurE, partial [Polyangiaceae bacterium]|nr:5'/3'-nucleotidase SurE [Polyangiaceae bacterium]
MTLPLILLSNDDGIGADGIHHLARALRTFARVIVCCPSTEQSASSHSLSLNRPLRIVEHGQDEFSVSGTPADSVYVALHQERVLERAPDLVVAGMNHGLNLGMDVFYSGTVAAAREGALNGPPSLAVSADNGADPIAAAKKGAEAAQALLQLGLTGGHLFNLNIPPQGSWEFVSTRLGKRVYSGGLVERHDPRGQAYYWV